MKRDDIKILMGIQKNADMSMKAIDAITSKTYDTELLSQIKRDGMEYADLYREATKELLDQNIDGFQSSALQDILVRSSIAGNTLFNNSRGHLAKIMIQNSNRGLTDMWTTLNHNENAEKRTMEIAKEFVDFEEKNIERLKKYL